MLRGYLQRPTPWRIQQQPQQSQQPQPQSQPQQQPQQRAPRAPPAWTQSVVAPGGGSVSTGNRGVLYTGAMPQASHSAPLARQARQLAPVPRPVKLPSKCNCG